MKQIQDRSYNNNLAVLVSEQMTKCKSGMTLIIARKFSIFSIIARLQFTQK